MVKIIILAGQTFRGVKYFYDTPMDVSANLAAHVVGTGVARYA